MKPVDYKALTVIAASTFIVTLFTLSRTYALALIGEPQSLWLMQLLGVL